MNRKEKAKKIIELLNNTPDGQIVDADTILKDYMDNMDWEISGIAVDLLKMFLDADKEKKGMFYDMFRFFTDRSFGEYLDECLEKTTK